MTKDEIKILILRRLYEIVFHEGREGIVNIKEFSASNNIDPEQAFKVVDEMKEIGFIEEEWSGGTYVFTPAALIYCEEQKLADPKLIDYQKKVRTKLLVTLAAMQEKSPYGEGADWQEWLQQADVSDQDFTNNHKIMQSMGLIRYESPREYFITPYGMNKVKEYQRRKRRLEEFEKLNKLDGVTEQQRGHKLEDLLGEIIKEEGWEVDKRVRVPGEEIDIIIHRGLEYFLISCKWEKKPTQSEELDIMYSRAMDRSNLKGSIIMSMTGFMDSCIKKAIGKMGNCHLVMFGPIDINKIIHNENSFSDLLQEKYKEVMLHRRILLDDKIRDVKIN